MKTISRVAGLSPIIIFFVLSFTNCKTALAMIGCVVIPESLSKGPTQLHFIKTLALGLINFSIHQGNQMIL